MVALQGMLITTALVVLVGQIAPTVSTREVGLPAQQGQSANAAPTQTPAQTPRTRMLHGILTLEGHLEVAYPRNFFNATKITVPIDGKPRLGEYVITFNMPVVPTAQVTIMERNASGAPEFRPTSVLIMSITQHQVRYKTLNQRRGGVDATTSFAVFWEE